MSYKTVLFLFFFAACSYSQGLLDILNSDARAREAFQAAVKIHGRPAFIFAESPEIKELLQYYNIDSIKTYLDDYAAGVNILRNYIADNKYNLSKKKLINLRLSRFTGKQKNVLNAICVIFQTNKLNCLQVETILIDAESKKRPVTDFYADGFILQYPAITKADYDKNKALEKLPWYKSNMLYNLNKMPLNY